MSTYDLNQYQLNTLLASTVVPSTSATIIAALEHVSGGPGVYYSEYPVGKQLIPVQTAPSSESGPITVGSDEALFIDTVPTSVIPPPGPKMLIPQTAPGPDTSGPYSTQTLITSGGVMIEAGDQNIKIWDQGPGDDTLVGGAGREALHVTSGNNLLIGGSGANTLYGGSGFDTLVGGGDSRLVGAMGLGAGNTSMVGGLAAGAHDTLVGGSGDDTLKVTYGSDRLVGGSGYSTLYGGFGDDTLVGGAYAGSHVDMIAGDGNQTLRAGAGSDSIQAGAGNDSITTGLTGNDTITAGTGTAAVYSAQTAPETVAPSATLTGYTEITFTDGQTLTVKGLQVDFTGGTHVNT
jgi:Ca2+-binding RTX toxin-like protein